MNEQDVFRKLALGVKFHNPTYLKDNRRFLNTPSTKFNIKDVASSEELDFFKTKSKQSTTVNATKVKKETEKPFKLVSDNEELNTGSDSKLDKNLDGQEKTASCNSSNETKDIKLNSYMSLRKQYKIYAEGSDIPQLITTFDQLRSVYKFNDTCMENIIENMGFHSLTPIQMQAIPVMLHRRDILACAPTGSGKTLAFLIPIVHHILSLQTVEAKKKRGFRALILSPTKELAEQTYRVCQQLVASSKTKDVTKNKKSLLRVKLLDKKESKIFNSSGQVHSKKMDILISTPSRLIYLLKQDTPMISLSDVEWLVVDESDKLFEEGRADSSFREQLGRIYAACSSAGVRRAMFSATFAFDVQQWCILNMDNVLQVTVGDKNAAVETVQQELQYVGSEQGKLLALRQIMQLGFTPPVLVFVQSKERAKELFVELIYDGKNVDSIHADRTPIQRENAVKCFRRGDTWILICTELMGRGIDFKGVNLVINYDFPTSAISYIHRIGRTGRAGRSGRAITFFTDDDKPLLRTIANVVRQAGCEIPGYMLKMRKSSRSQLKSLKTKQLKRRAINTIPAEMPEKRRKEAYHHGNKSTASTNISKKANYGKVKKVSNFAAKHKKLKPRPKTAAAKSDKLKTESNEKIQKKMTLKTAPTNSPNNSGKEKKKRK